MKEEQVLIRVPFSIKANETEKFNLIKPFEINDSMLSVIHFFESGNLKVNLYNATGASIEKVFKIMPAVPVIIAFSEFTDEDNLKFNNMGFLFAALTPDVDLKGEFSFSKGYSKEQLNLCR